MYDGVWEACALKKLPYQEPVEQQAVHSELEALYLALDMPNMVQGLAAFHHTCPDTNETSVWVATRSVVLTGWLAR